MEARPCAPRASPSLGACFAALRPSYCGPINMGEPAYQSTGKLFASRMGTSYAASVSSDRQMKHSLTPCSLPSWPNLFLMATKDGTKAVDEVARQVSYVHFEDVLVMAFWGTELRKWQNIDQMAKSHTYKHVHDRPRTLDNRLKVSRQSIGPILIDALLLLVIGIGWRCLKPIVTDNGYRLAPSLMYCSANTYDYYCTYFSKPEVYRKILVK